MEGLFALTNELNNKRAMVSSGVVEVRAHASGEQQSLSQSNGNWRGRGQALENNSADKAIFCNREDQ